MKKLILLILAGFFIVDFASATLSFNYTQGLKSCLPFDKNATDMYTGLTFSENAVLNQSEFKIGSGSYWFDGNNDFVAYASLDGDLYDIDGDVTVCTWLKQQTTGTYRLIFSNPDNNNDWQLSHSSSGWIVFVTEGGNFDERTSFAIDSNVWYHVCAVYRDETDIDIYVNGTNVTTVSDAAFSFNGNTSYFIGNRGDLGSDYLGYVDEVVYWNRILNDSEISELYNSSVGVSCADIIASGQEEEEPPADSCDYTSGNWAISCSDNCVFSSAESISGNISITGAGVLKLLANWTFTGTNQFITMNSGCELDINSGGGFN